LRAYTPGYYPSADRFVLLALAGFDVTILEQTHPASAPAGAVN
jgi:hypothetical protein